MRHNCATHLSIELVGCDLTQAEFGSVAAERKNRFDCGIGPRCGGAGLRLTTTIEG
jgi:hypothetical protein